MTPETLGVTPDLGADAADWRILITLGFVLAVMLVRWGIVRLIRSRTSLPAEIQRWWVTLTRNSFNVLAVLGVIVIWAPEIEYFALSITAFAVALVIATKELILCVSGALWRGVARPFGIGDWVQIGTHFGEVIDESFLATVLQEIDQSECRYSGRTVAVPNSILLAAPVINENFRKRYTLHEFTLYSEPHPEAIKVRDAIAAALEQAAAEFAEVARRYAAVIERRAGVKLADVGPVVRIGTTEFAKIAFRCMLFCPRERTAELEEVAVAAYLAAGGARPVGH